MLSKYLTPKIILTIVAAGVISYFLYKKYGNYAEDKKSEPGIVTPPGVTPPGSFPGDLPLKGNPPYTDDDVAKIKEALIKQCQDDCSLWNDTCMEPCKHLPPKYAAACAVTCKATAAICNATCSGKVGIRNASLNTIKIYDKDKKIISQLGPADPRNQNLEITDFPIYASRCLIDHPACNPRDERLLLKIEKPGCYILWGGSDSMALYTTKGAC